MSKLSYITPEQLWFEKAFRIMLSYIWCRKQFSLFRWQYVNGFRSILINMAISMECVVRQQRTIMKKLTTQRFMVIEQSKEERVCINIKFV